MTEYFTVENEEGDRIDRYLAEEMPEAKRLAEEKAERERKAAEEAAMSNLVMAGGIVLFLKKKM